MSERDYQHEAWLAERRDYWAGVAEAQVREASDKLVEIEQQLAQEYLLHMAAGQQTWAAQKMAEVRYGADLRKAQAEYEIALARLRRA